MQGLLTRPPLELPVPDARGHGEAASDASVLDDPAEWPAFGRPLGDADGADRRWESGVVVEGMHCVACASTVEAVLSQVPGVLEARVNAATGRAQVVWSADRVSPSRWFAAARAAGYPLLPAGDLAARGRRAKANKQALWRWLVAGFCMMQVMMYAYPAYIAAPGEMTADAVQLMRWASWVLSLPVLLFSCQPFFANAWRDLKLRSIGMDLPVALGMLITFVVSSAATFDPTGLLGGEVYFDSFTMFVFFLLTGRWLEARLRDRTAGALEALMNRMPDSVERRGADGTFVRVAVRRLAVGDVVRVLPGEAFPGDGTLVDGQTSADEALLSGESRPVPKAAGAAVLAGSYNLAAAVQVRIDALGSATRFAQIVALMESASLGKPRLALLADRIARPFLVAVLLAAVGALVFWWPVDHGKALMAAVAVLIVTCPCALSLATPAAMLASAGALARRGVLTGRLQALEALAAIDTVVFDKTGTLTDDTPKLERVYCREGVKPGDALELAAALGAGSLHPAARALVAAWQAQSRVLPVWDVLQQTEHGGQGVEGRLRRHDSALAAARNVQFGSATFCGVQPLPVDSAQVHLADEAGWIASFVLTEQLRADAAAAIAQLRSCGIAVQLLSGDRERAARSLAERAGIAVAQGDCQPEDKLRVLRALQAQGRRVAMVGDGLNDGPVLASADASFAFGSAVPLSRARADFIVPGGALSAIPQAILQARRTLRVVRQNLWWAAGYNALCVPLALAGLLPAWLAGIGMAASSLVVVGNAARLSRQRKTSA